MLLLGIDIGTSFIKASVVDAATQQSVASAQYPDTEAAITSLQSGWAEQSPDTWWDYTVKVINALHAANTFDVADIAAIGISYQMHGLVVVDKEQHVLRDSIIWCDSRAIETGKKALKTLVKKPALPAF